MHRFLSQKHAFSCFPTAAINGCIWSKVPQPLLTSLMDIAACHAGATIHYESVLRATGLNWERSESSEILKSQGIITIMHPQWNLHSLFVFNEGGKTYTVNSLLTDRLIEVADDEVPLLAKVYKPEIAWILKP